jgi:hydroxyacylglutathione hydrolase
MLLNDHSTEYFVFYQTHFGGDRNFTYLLGDAVTRECAVVDPGFDAPGILALAKQHELNIMSILITHGHSDHVGAAAELAELTGARIRAGAGSTLPEVTIVHDDQLIDIGKFKVQGMLTPGHSPDHVCYLCYGSLLTGDLLFCGKVGGTGDYFPGSSARQEWDSLRKIIEMRGPTLVFPGHDYYGGPGEMPHSTIEYERTHNPFLTCADFQAFVDLKENWAAYKEKHGIR